MRDTLVDIMTRHHLNTFDEAEAMVKGWIAQDKQRYKESHPLMIKDMTLLAKVLFALDKSEETFRVMQRVMQATKTAHGPEHPLVAEQLCRSAPLKLATCSCTVARVVVRGGAVDDGAGGARRGRSGPHARKRVYRVRSGLIRRAAGGVGGAVEHAPVKKCRI